MTEKLDFLKKIESRLSRVEKDTLYHKLRESVQEQILFRHICQNIEEGVLLLGPAGSVRFINRRAETWLALPSKPPVKTPVWELLSDATLSRFLKENLPGLDHSTVTDLRVLTPREIELRLTLSPYALGTEQGVLVLMNEISRSPEGEFETAMSRRMESLVRLAGGIAHEIGNPLNAIMIHLELMKKRLKGLPSAKREEMESALSDIQQETKRLDRIIRNFLKATRKPPLRFRLADLGEILEDAVNFLKPELTAAKIRMKMTRDDSLPPFLMDRERLYYAFMNLIKNALEAMPKGGDLKLSLIRRENCAVVSIQDTGCGIAPEELPRIFDIYYTNKQEGSGLGLMMVYDAVTEHGGRIDVVSKLGKGSTFKIILPVREPQKQLPDYTQPKGGTHFHV